MLILRVFLFCAYPIAIHSAIYFDRPALTILGLVFFWLGIFLHRLLPLKSLKALSFWAATIAFATGLIILLRFNAAVWIAVIPPVLIPALVASVFIMSLMPNNKPLVADIGERARGKLEPRLYKYAVNVTRLWAVLLVMISIESLLLALFASPALWSLVTGFLNYFIVGAVMVAEFYLRRQLFPGHDHPTFIEYIKIVINGMRARHAS